MCFIFSGHTPLQAGNQSMNSSPIADCKLSPLSLGSIEPTGWLHNQLEIQAKGATGQLTEFWPDLGPNSGWLGGTGESWERGPYYLDGLIPLAYTLQDRELMARARKWVGWILSHQAENGWLGPKGSSDWWPAGVMLKVLTQYQEATGDPRVIPAMTRFFGYMHEELPKRPLESWGKHRWADTAISVIWLYNRTHDKNLIDLLNLLNSQGFDWSKYFADFKYKDKVLNGYIMDTHGVNNAMGLKAPGVQYLITKDGEYKAATYRMIEQLDKYHGQVTGMFTCDEHYAGKNPSQGTELCTVVEYLFSLENLIAIFKDPALADKWERIAFNALPATFSPDMNAHQYDQQVNQVICKVSDDRIYTNNGPDSNLFGVEPNFGCCTANQHQGWPKFTSHLWMQTPDKGLAAISYAPCSVKANVADGKSVTIRIDTEYPFDENVRITIQTDGPVSFPLDLRIPGWAQGATVRATGERHHPKSGTFFRLTREWKNGDVINLTLPMHIEVERRFNDSIAILRGPLVYSLKIGEDWRKLRGNPPAADYEVYPTTPWNYGLLLDTTDPEKSLTVSKKPLADCIFSVDSAPVELHVKGRLVPGWKMEHNAAGVLPKSPVVSDEPVIDLTLIPYGCAKLRITEFPLLAN